MATKPLKPGTLRFAPRLTVQTGPNPGCEYIVTQDALIVGRNEQCDIVIANPLVSRRHSQISWDGAYCTLEDLNSTNGTYVNGHRIIQPRVLRSGDEVRVGDMLLEPPNRVYVNRKATELSTKEFALLTYLYDHAERICSKRDIAAAVWPDYDGEVFDYQIESLVKRLRQKIEVNPEDPQIIVTLRGRGYQLVKS
jgi:pSer/pThr/pTyr-binding forkhead associated (FHA) protein